MSNYNCDNKEYCKRSDYKNKSKMLIVPMEIENEELRQVFSFFLYRAPFIPSCHSMIVEKVDSDKEEEILKKLLINTNNEVEFRTNKKSFLNKIESMQLHNSSVCLRCKRGVCIFRRESDFSKLRCLIRHIRNSIAHGYVYYEYDNRIHRIMFEDYDRNKNISARIVCVKSDLLELRKMIRSMNSV